jgi:hypothetical protein
MSRTDLGISHASVLLRRGHDQVDLDIALGELLDQYLYRERFKFSYRCKLKRLLSQYILYLTFGSSL